MQAPLILLFLTLLGACFAAPIQIAGAGSTFQEPVETEWLFAYTLLRPEVKATYQGIGSGKGQADLRAGLIDWAGTDLTPTDSDLVNFPNIKQFPIVAGQIAVIINVPGVASEQLNLSRNALAGIFSGNITRWDHAEILSSNPALTAVQLNYSITVVIRKDSSGSTQILTSALTKFNSTLFPLGIFQQWPSSITSLSNFVVMQGSTGVSGLVQTIPFSLGYAVSEFAVADAVPVALIENARMQYTSPNNIVDTGNALASTVTLFNDTTNTADVIDFDGDNAYPLLSYTYIQIRTYDDNGTIAEQLCDESRELLKIFRWAFTTDTTQQTARLKGYIPLPNTVFQRVLDQFGQLTCNGAQLLRTTYEKQHTSKLFEVILAFSMLFWALALLAIGYSWYSSSRAKNPLFYALCLIAGTSCSFLSVIFFYLLPTKTVFCELRKWLLAMGLTILLSVMFARGWQLHALKRGPRVISTMRLLLMVVVLSSIQVVLLIVWTAVDPYKSISPFINNIDLQATYKCHSKHSLVWLLLEMGYFVALLAWGIYVVYATWRNRAAVDSRWTLIAVYNTLIAMLMVILLLATSVNSDDWVFYVAVLASDFSVVSCVFSIYGSAILRRLWDSVSKSSGSGESGGPSKVSSLRMTVAATGGP